MLAIVGAEPCSPTTNSVAQGQTGTRVTIHGINLLGTTGTNKQITDVTLAGVAATVSLRSKVGPFRLHNLT